MRIFILEDDPERIRYFATFFAGHDVTQVESCASHEAFEPPYDLVFLDHDLGGRQLEAHEDNGAAFARLIRDRVANIPVIIHSFNPLGAWAIEHELKSVTDVYQVPFKTQAFYAILSSLPVGKL